MIPYVPHQIIILQRASLHTFLEIQCKEVRAIFHFEAKRIVFLSNREFNSHPDRNYQFQCLPAAYFESPLCNVEYLLFHQTL